MAASPTRTKVLQKTIETWLKCNRVSSHAAKAMRVPESTFAARLARGIQTLGAEFGLTIADIPKKSELKEMSSARKRGRYDKLKAEHDFHFTPLPDDDLPIEELVEHRKKQFRQKHKHEQARALVRIKVSVPGPIAILHMGDPHVDDDGTDILALESDTDLVNSTEGMFLGNVGDMTNNWVGRLAHLYSQQSTSAKQAWKLAEWLLGRCKPIYLIGGNHDAWSGDADPLKWITRQKNALYQSSECRIQLDLPGDRAVRINARHDFAGHSQYNPAHGPTKALMFGVRDHIAICGHRHKTGYNVIKDPTTGIVCHAVQVASYKLYDRYARDRGFRDQSLSPSATTVINTMLPDDHPDFVKVFWDPQEGARALRDLRRHWKAKR